MSFQQYIQMNCSHQYLNSGALLYFKEMGTFPCHNILEKNPMIFFVRDVPFIFNIFLIRR